MQENDVKYAARMVIYCPESSKQLVNATVGLSTGKPSISDPKIAEQRAMKKTANKLVNLFDAIPMERWNHLKAKGISWQGLSEFDDVKQWAYDLIEQSSEWTLADNLSIGSFVLQVRTEPESGRPKSIMDLLGDEEVGE